MEEVKFKILENKKLTDLIYILRLEGNTKSIKNSGEFVNLKLPNYYLRRPISVADFDENTLTLIYKILGEGTKDLSKLEEGTYLDILVGLGNGFNLDTKKPLLVAGGIGIAPFVKVIKEFNKKGIKPTLVYGEQTKDNFILLDFFKENTNLYLTTDDGSVGFKGNAVSFLKENKIDFTTYYACGPLPMLKSLSEYNDNGYLSLEARMGCGFGACMGCSIKTTNGFKRVCKEGPVFMASEVIYE